MRFKILMAVKISSGLWCHVVSQMVTNIPENGNHLQDWMVTQPRRPQLTNNLKSFVILPKNILVWHIITYLALQI